MPLGVCFANYIIQIYGETMSKWDWIHAGLEAATYVQARKAQQNLAEMKTASEIESARRMLLEAMKSFVFDISRDIQLAEEQISSTPQQVYIISKLIDSRFLKSGVTSDIFPDFQDKEYVFKTQKKVAEVVKKSKTLLTEEQIEQSDLVVQYIPQMSLIQKAISSKVAQEFLQESDKRWEELKKNTQTINPTLIPSLIWIIIIWMILSVIIGGMGIQSGFGYLIVATGVVVALVGMIYKNKKSPSNAEKALFSEYELLKNKREESQKQLLSQKDWAKVVSTIGDLTSEQFKKIYKKRLDLLSQVLGEETQKFLSSEE